MRPFHLNGIAGTFYEQNFHTDTLPLIKYGDQSITTGEMKSKIDTVIEYLSHAISAYSMMDERAEKYSTALTVFKFIRHVFDKPNKHRPYPSKADIKIAMNVIAEIAVAQETNEITKNAIKTVNILAQLSIGSD